MSRNRHFENCEDAECIVCESYRAEQREKGREWLLWRYKNKGRKPRIKNQTDSQQVLTNYE